MWLDGWINLWYHLRCDPIPWEIKIWSPYCTDLGKIRNVPSEIIQSPPILFTNPQTSPVYLRRLLSIIKILALGNKILSWRNLNFSPVPLRGICFLPGFLRELLLRPFAIPKMEGKDVGWGKFFKNANVLIAPLPKIWSTACLRLLAKVKHNFFFFFLGSDFVILRKVYI